LATACGRQNWRDYPAQGKFDYTILVRLSTYAHKKPAAKAAGFCCVDMHIAIISKKTVIIFTLIQIAKTCTSSWNRNNLNPEYRISWTLQHDG
jgi:hypothetical protein